MTSDATQMNRGQQQLLADFLDAQKNEQWRHWSPRQHISEVRRVRERRRLKAQSLIRNTKARWRQEIVVKCKSIRLIT